jgi:hypothetical protein
MSVLDTLENPDVLAAAATLAALAPAPAGPILAAALRMAEAWLRAGKSIDEVNAIVARYSAEAQELADSWPTAGA